ELLLQSTSNTLIASRTASTSADPTARRSSLASAATARSNPWGDERSTAFRTPSTPSSSSSAKSAARATTRSCSSKADVSHTRVLLQGELAPAQVDQHAAVRALQRLGEPDRVSLFDLQPLVT